MPDLRDVFRTIYKKNYWKDPETRSGYGSTLNFTQDLRAQLPALLGDLGVTSILDAGCGDWNWMSQIDFGSVWVSACDIVPELIEENKRRYAGKAIFSVADITADELPYSDLIFCRTVLFHLSFKNIKNAIVNMSRYASYLLLTDNQGLEVNVDKQDGDFRHINLQKSPFFMPSPMLTIADGDAGSISLWEVQK